LCFFWRLFVEERLTALLLVEVLMNLFRGRRSAFTSLLFVEVLMNLSDSTARSA
jgi:hypothetical protein